MIKIITLPTDAHIEQLRDILQEHEAVTSELLKHYENSPDALGAAGAEPEEQRQNFTAAIDSNAERLKVITDILSQLND